MRIGPLLRAGVLACIATRASTGRVALAQQGGLGSVTGVAYDSVRGRPLARAEIEVEGTTRAALTSADGRFRIDSVPVGQHRILARHPVVDSLGFNVLRSQFYTFSAAETLRVELVT